MSKPLDIPEDELRQFQPYLQIYTKGKTIIEEGHKYDQRFFLLRQGEVEVTRAIGDRQQVIGNIQAVNFFGEIAIISQRPRTATVIAKSDPTVVYAFENPNISAILGHSTWGNMFIKRLTDNLEKMNQEFEQSQIKMERLNTAMSEILGTILDLQSVAISNEEAKDLFLKSIPELIKSHQQELNIEILLPTKDRLDQYRRRGIISPDLYVLAMGVRSERES